MTVGRSTKGTIWNLQVLRFVAAAMVLFGHLNHAISDRSDMAASFRSFAPIWWASGVDIFFVISGFIMFYITADQFGRRGAAVRFVERRLVRLAPPYWFFTTLTLAAMILLPQHMALHDFLPWQAIASYLFIPALNPEGHAFPILILGWTLNFEMLFYAVFAIGLQFRRPVGVVVIGAILLAIAGAYLLQPLPQPFGFWADTIVLIFLYGIGIALAKSRGVVLPHWQGWALALLGVALFVAVEAAGVTGSNWRWRFLWGGVPAALVVAGFALMREAEVPGPIKKWLIFGGDASFSLYLSHPFILSAVAIGTRWVGIRSPWAYLTIAFVACLVGAGLVYRLIERPLYTFVGRALDRARERRVVATV